MVLPNNARPGLSRYMSRSRTIQGVAILTLVGAFSVGVYGDEEVRAWLCSLLHDLLIV